MIQIKNNYDREVFNGDAGYAVKVDPAGKSMVVEFPETDYQKIQDGTPAPTPFPSPPHFFTSAASTVHVYQRQIKPQLKYHTIAYFGD